MSRVWIPVSPVQARAHPLYGRGGWLILYILCVALILAISGGFWAIIVSARSAADSVIRFLGVYSAISAFAGVVILSLFILKSPNFRIAAIGLMLVPWPVLAGIYYELVPETMILGGSALWLVSVAIWATYLQRSKRVRVTFEHCVIGDPSDVRTEPAYLPMLSHADGNPSLRDAPGVMAEKFDVINSHRDDAVLSDAEREEHYWSQALAEYDSGQKKPGIWARAYAEAQGDDAAAKAHYLKFRAAQLLDEYQEHMRQLDEQYQAQQRAVERNEQYENSLTNHQRKILWAIEQVESGGEGAFNAAIQLINLLGGKAERKPSVVFSSSGWRVELAGYQDKFPDDHELMQWVVSEIIPKARMLLPPNDA